MLDSDIHLRKPRDIVIFVIFGILLNNAFGALWGTVTLALGNEIAWAQVSPAFFAWFAGNVIITALIVPLALRYVTPKIERSRVFVRHYWD